MKAEHGPRFTVNAERAALYDERVTQVTDPIRQGYLPVLEWVARKAAIQPHEVVVDVGVGTGNLSALLPPCQLTGVDLSEPMLALARAKLPSLHLVHQDLLEWAFEEGALDVVVASHALHHLTTDEKRHFVLRVADRLRPGGRLVIGDLGFPSADAEQATRAQWAHHDPHGMTAKVDDEFFWLWDEAIGWIYDKQMRPELEMLGPVTWGLALRKR